ncbi:MAG: trypsin-like peptidase domain-containing protein [Thiobacillaceae bacterium]|nr:trypsin-like peptidase domain-containing protein [Thiobacillaceae bacterium]
MRLVLSRLRAFWLVFAQLVAAAAVLLAALAALDRLLPGLLSRDQVDASGRHVPAEGHLPPGVSYAEAARRAQPAVVNIYTTKLLKPPRHPLLSDPLPRGEPGAGMQPRAPRVTNLGSGVIVSPEGYILTNHHVIEAADEIQVALPDGRSLAAELVGTDPDTDLAVLRVRLAGLPAIRLAPPDSLRVGDVVLAIGNPFGVGQTVTLGIVSGLNRTHLGINTFENFIQTDAAINPGNSGGALVDTEGRLVGINTAIFSRSGGNQGIGFAIPVSLAREVMQQIIAQGSVTRGWVGIEVQDITPEVAESFGLGAANGALIAGVLRGGPADRAGIRPGDVLVSVNDRPVTDSSDLLNLIAALPPGERARLTVLRGQTRLQLTVQVERRPSMRRPAAGD